MDVIQFDLRKRKREHSVWEWLFSLPFSTSSFSLSEHFWNDSFWLLFNSHWNTNGKLSAFNWEIISLGNANRVPMFRWWILRFWFYHCHGLRFSISNTQIFREKETNLNFTCNSKMISGILYMHLNGCVGSYQDFEGFNHPKRFLKENLDFPRFFNSRFLYFFICPVINSDPNGIENPFHSLWVDFPLYRSRISGLFSYTSPETHYLKNRTNV